MTTPDPAFSERALERIWKAMFAIGTGGTVAAWGWRGWESGAGFLMGAAASALNFRWIKQIVDALGGKGPTQTRVAVLAGLRYLLLSGGAYVILKYSSISIAALLMGLFVPVAAVIVEIVIELAYART